MKTVDDARLLHCRREHKSCEFELHEAYAIDIIISSGEGKVSSCTFVSVSVVSCTCIEEGWSYSSYSGGVFLCMCIDLLVSL